MRRSEWCGLLSGRSWNWNRSSLCGVGIREGRHGDRGSSGRGDGSSGWWGEGGESVREVVVKFTECI